MKIKQKLFLILFILLFVPFFSAAATVLSAPYPHYMVGFINTSMDINVEIFQNALPFDLESSDVAHNYTSLVRGLKIGQYTLIANTSSFQLTVTHTPLVHKQASNVITNTNSIDYVLYVYTKYSTQKYKYCASTPHLEDYPTQVEILGTDEDIFTEGSAIYSLTNQSLYLSLYDPDGTLVPALETGEYESTITFALEGV